MDNNKILKDLVYAGFGHSVRYIDFEAYKTRQQKELLQNWIDMYKDAIVLNKNCFSDEKLFYYADQIIAIARHMENL